MHHCHLRSWPLSIYIENNSGHAKLASLLRRAFEMGQIRNSQRSQTSRCDLPDWHPRSDIRLQRTFHHRLIREQQHVAYQGQCRLYHHLYRESDWPSSLVRHTPVRKSFTGFRSATRGVINELRKRMDEQEKHTPKADVIQEHKVIVTTDGGSRSKVPAEVPVAAHVLPEHSISATGNDAGPPTLQPSSPEADGTASITSTPDGAEIFVDSVGHGHTPALLKLKPGIHRVQLVLQGYKDSLIDVEVKTDSIVNVTGKLEK